jgi:lysosomal acid lipase/cholesteryl ester hydrolase
MYSRNHTSLDPELEPFWQFSWDQMGRYDLPAMLDLALGISGAEQLTYVGHSMGTTAFWVMMNWRPWMNSKIGLMVGLAPVAAVPNMYSPLRHIAPIARQVERVLSLTGQYEFGARDSLFSDLGETLCHGVTRADSRDESACAVPENIIFSIAGFDAPQMNFTLLPVILGHTPAGTSSRTMLHFAQVIILIILILLIILIILIFPFLPPSPGGAERHVSRV